MRKLQKKSIVWKWVLWCVVIMCVLIIANITLYSHGRNALLAQQQSEMSLQLDSIVQRLERSLREVDELGNVLLGDLTFIDMAMERESQFRVAYSKYLMRESLIEKQQLNESFTQIFLYFEDLGMIVSNTSSASEAIYWKLNQEEMGISRGTWRELITGSFNGIEVLRAEQDQEENGAILYARTLCNSGANFQKVNMFVLLSQDSMEQMIQTSGGTVQLLGPMESQIQRYGSSLREDFVEETRDISFGQVSLRLSEEDFYGRMDQFVWMFILSTIIAVTLCFLLIVFFVRANYRPIRRMLGILPGSGDWAFEEQNEYELAQHRIQYMIETSRQLSRKVSAQQKFFREQYLWNILEGEPTKGAAEEVRMPGPFYAVLGVYIDEQKENNLEAAYFIIQNVYGEMLEKGEIHSEWVVRRGLLFAILWGECLKKTQLDPWLKQAADFVEENFGMEYELGISQEYQNLSQLADANQEVLQMMEFQRYYGMDELSFYEDFSQTVRGNYYYPFSLEQELLSKIRSGDEEGAEDLFSKILQENRDEEGFFPGGLFRFLIYDLTGTLYKAIQTETGNEELLHQLRPLQHRLQTAEIFQLQQIYEEMLRMVCRSIRQTEEKDSLEFQIRQIEEYMSEHYEDCNLTIATLAEHFQRNAVQMSKIYKEKTGTKILTRLAEIRCEQAKKLLIETQLNVTQIAERTGFGSLRTFLRVFKQITGFTPSSYREEYQR